MKRKLAGAILFCLSMGMQLFGQETLAVIEEGDVPQTFEALWAGYNPRTEPLDVEILKAWEQDGVVLQVLRYRIGIFKGQKAMMAGVYGYPKGAKHLPGLVQIHGGGQYAHANAVFTNAKRGYASLSISWAGRIDAPDYRVNPEVVKLFWEGKTDDPRYKVTTDWGRLDGYHAPSRNPKNQFPSFPAPSEWTLDAVVSPRNNSWFLCTLGARRALTFLEQQPEVDGNRLGVYGHSMGGKLTVLTAGADDRVKAAAPSCGGISDRYNKDPLFRATIGDDAYLRRITCPIMFLSPANDFHGRINDLQTAVTEIKSKAWRATCAAHHNHQDTAPYEVATQIWFDQHLKGTFTVPETPQAQLTFHGGVPRFAVRPDDAKPILAVDVFYTQQGRIDEIKDDRDNTIARFWRHAKAVKDGKVWSADLALFDTDRPLWVYANVRYSLDEPITGAGYYYSRYTTDQFNLSSLMAMVTPDALKAAGARATLGPSLLIESFEGDWGQEWFSYKPETWPRKTHKVYDPQWAAPSGAQLALKVRTSSPNKLVVGLDEHAAVVELIGGPDWQQVRLSPADFRNARHESLSDWNGIRELRLADRETLKEKDQRTTVGAIWKGDPPEFRHLRWVDAR